MPDTKTGRKHKMQPEPMAVGSVLLARPVPIDEAVPKNAMVGGHGFEPRTLSV